MNKRLNSIINTLLEIVFIVSLGSTFTTAGMATADEVTYASWVPCWMQWSRDTLGAIMYGSLITCVGSLLWWWLRDVRHRSKWPSGYERE